MQIHHSAFFFIIKNERRIAVELHHLTTFRTFARLQGFRRAADALGYTEERNDPVQSAEPLVAPFSPCASAAGANPFQQENISKH